MSPRARADSVRPRLQFGGRGRPLNFTVRRPAQRVRFQLIIQLPGDASGDLDRLVALEDVLIDRLGPDAEVDGHDIGSSQGNIFVLTTSPECTFAQVRPLLLESGLLGVTRVAYRNLEGGKFTVLWPESDSGQFVVT